MKFLLAMVFSISRRLAVISVSALSVSAMLGPSAWAQNQGDLVGTWMLVSSVTEKDGARTDQFGVGAKGMLSLDADGHFMLTILGPDLPRFVSNNRATGTQQEDKAVVSKGIAMIGSYSFHASDKALTFKVESANSMGEGAFAGQLSHPTRERSSNRTPLYVGFRGQQTST